MKFVVLRVLSEQLGRFMSSMLWSFEWSQLNHLKFIISNQLLPF